MTLRIYDDVIQGEEEWLELRRGMVTASTVGQLLTVDTLGAEHFACPACDAEPNEPCKSMAKGRTGPIQTMHKERFASASAAAVTDVRPSRDDTATRLTLLLLAERISGRRDPREDYQSNDMLAGQLDEPLARDVYSGHYEHVTETGFMVEDKWGFRLGYSPDGLVGDDGLIEVKSPRTKEHIRTILADEVPERYMPQLQAGLLVSGRKWIDFVSFCGGLPLWTKRIYPSALWQDAITAAVAAFEERAQEMTTDYTAATRGLPATEARVPIEMNTVELSL